LEYCERVLEFKEMIGPHTAENLTGVVLECLDEFYLREKLLSITADNATSNESMMVQLEHQLQISTPNSRFEGLRSFVRCLAHTINLIVKEILGSVRASSFAMGITGHSRQGIESSCHLSATENVRTLILYLSGSPQRRQGWKSLCALNAHNEDAYGPLFRGAICMIDGTFIRLSESPRFPEHIRGLLELEEISIWNSRKYTRF
jgi:hypothetical protein